MLWNRLERNAIYELIKKKGVDPAECNFTITDDKVIIEHSSGSTFQVAHKADSVSGKRSRYDLISIVEDGPTLKTIIGTPFYGVLGLIDTWASQVAAPDLWAEMLSQRDLLADIQQGNTGNAPFNQDEQRQITTQLQEITKQLKEQFELTKEQEERIDEWRDEVVEASTRMGRKDWLIYLLGTITALTIAATVPAGVGEHIFTMVLHGLGHLFTGGEPPRILT
jgi:hypothetical protein